MSKNKFENIWNQELETAINKVDVNIAKFKIPPVIPKEFFEIWMKMPLFPRQYTMVNNVFTPDFKDWNKKTHEIMLMYGEGGGKDTLTTRSLCYCAYWLLCLNNPQEYLQSGTGTPIVLLNCCLAGKTKIYDCKSQKYIPIAVALKNKTEYTLALNENTGEVSSHKIKRIFKTGRKMTYKLKVKYGNQFKTIIATQDHRFLTPSGWKPLENLRVGDTTYIRLKDRNAWNKGLSTSDLRVKKNQDNRVNTVVLKYETNNIMKVPTISSIVGNKLKEYYQSHVLPWTGKKLPQDMKDNLRKKMTGISQGPRSPGSGENISSSKWESIKEGEIISIDPHKIIPTYDIEMEAPHHNFIANNFVVHNSFKEEHASGIFFKQFTNCLRQVINPSTGHNWFEEQGMDLREGKSIQNRKVVFPNHIEADSESCLPGKTPVTLEDGSKLEISHIVRNRIKTKVKALNIKTGQIENCDIKNYFVINDPSVRWVKIHTDFRSSTHPGNILKCTDDHRIWTTKGWVLAGNLRKGDTIYSELPGIDETQFQVLLGMLLGDGSISQDNRSFSVGHSIKQQDYLKDIVRVLSPHSHKISYVDRKSKFGTFKSCSSGLYHYDLITQFKDISIQGNWDWKTILSKLTPLGLAVWYMDDGNYHIRKATGWRQLSIALPNTKLTTQDEKLIIEYFNFLGITTRIKWRNHKKYPYLYISQSVSVDRFFKLVRPYICTSMSYKLGENFTNLFWETYKYIPIPTKIKVCNVEIIPKNKWKQSNLNNTKYCIEVDKNHTFIANGILVSNSVRYSAEGKNVLLAVFDEIAEFRYDKAKALYENLKNTSFSRFADHYKIVSISYPRDEYDYFNALYQSVEALPPDEHAKVFRDKASSWEVRNKEGAHQSLITNRIYRTEEDYAPFFRANPEDAMRRYKCEFPIATSGKYLKKFELVLDKCVNFERPSPILWESLEDREFSKIYVTEKELMDIQWQPWFKPVYSYEAYQIEQELLKTPTSDELSNRLKKELERHEGTSYFIHADLSQGLGDCAGIVLMHPYLVTPTITGYYVDLAIQIRSDEGEINFDYIKQFILKLSSMGFDIDTCTFDGFQSVYLRQVIQQEGIKCDIISVDRTRKPYDTLKGLLYQGKVNLYDYLVPIRELKELIVSDKSKVDHPKESNQRLKEEGMRNGCFHPDTQIISCDGNTYKISDLVEKIKQKDIYLYCLDSNERIISKKIKKVWITKQTSELVKVTLDNFTQVLTTPEHLFRKRNGTWIEAKNLLVNDRLTPLHRSIPMKRDYVKIYSLQDDNWYYEHKYLLNLEKSDLVVHHIDFNKLNNELSNLRAMTLEDHSRYHGKLRNMKNMLQKAHEWNVSPQGRATHSKVLTTLQKEGKLKHPSWMKGLTMADPRVAKVVEAGASSRRGKSSWCAGLNKNNNSTLSTLGHNVSLTKLGFNITTYKEKICNMYLNGFSTTKIAADIKVSKDVIRKYLKEWKVYNSNCKMSDYKLNHKVINVEFIHLLSPIEVYDLEIDDNQIDTFALANGIFVHNSKDIADGLAATVYAAVIQEAESGPSCVDSEESEEAHLENPFDGRLRRRSTETIEENEENNENLYKNI
jgi:intein/homing endonuclease